MNPPNSIRQAIPPLQIPDIHAGEDACATQLLNFLTSYLLFFPQSQAEADVVIAARRGVKDAKRCPAGDWAAVPTAAAKDPVGARFRTRGILSRTLLIIFFLIPIRTPLPDIPGHIQAAIRAYSTREYADRTGAPQAGFF